MTSGESDLNLESLRSKLEEYGQDHLLDFWPELSASDRIQLAGQIAAIDFAELRSLHRDAARNTDLENWVQRSSPPLAIRAVDNEATASGTPAREHGEALLRDGKLAALLVAGGQGTRLGFDFPKGMLPVGPLSNRTLFQIHADRIRALERRYLTSIPWLIMTSAATHQDTLSYLARENAFGLDPDQIWVFCQGSMPAVDRESGRVLLESKGRIATSPDGHGGTLAALEKSGLLARLSARGIEQVFYFQVDNPLVDIGDPSTVGHHLLANSELTTQVVAKRDPLERVGNVVSVDGRLRIVEYSDLPEGLARMRNQDGSLRIWAGSIAVHVFTVSFLQRMSRSSGVLPFHQALKRVAFVDRRGVLQQPSEPNAIKFERFIFDILPEARNALVVEVDPTDAFAPVKNAAGATTDTLATAQAAMMSQHRRWLRSAGVQVADNVRVEINPAFAATADELRDRVEAGTVVDRDTYLI